MIWAMKIRLILTGFSQEKQEVLLQTLRKTTRREKVQDLSLFIY